MSLNPGSDVKAEGKNYTKFSSDFHTYILTHTHTYALMRITYTPPQIIIFSLKTGIKKR